MGGVAVPELAGTVAHAGALGMLCEFALESSEDRMRRALDLAAGGSVGMGFFGHWMSDDLATFERAADRLRVVEIFWTAPDASLVDRARPSGKALIAWQVGSVADAVAAQDAGCDFVVAQGIGAGGHVRGTAGRDALLQAVLAKVSIPVVIAGGIANASDVARAIGAGQRRGALRARTRRCDHTRDPDPTTCDHVRRGRARPARQSSRSPATESCGRARVGRGTSRHQSRGLAARGRRRRHVGPCAFVGRATHRCARCARRGPGDRTHETTGRRGRTGTS